jgi:hypothetical protein
MTYTPGQYRLGQASIGRLSTCHPIWAQIIPRALAISPMDFSVVCGFRGEDEQNAAFNADPPRSTKRFPGSLHNHLSDQQDVDDGWASQIGQKCSLAIDNAPYIEGRIRWDLPDEIRWLNGFILGVGMPIAQAQGFFIRSGNDWDMDGNQTEHTLVDSPHLGLWRLP